MKAEDSSERFEHFYHYIWYKLTECLNLHAKSISFLPTSACLLTTWDLLPHA